ncbi:predicted protein [Lichtheimia corymbifera JMRC:FSU:9682]|uniref:Pentacotripeptide-repeat region of PRORP domain-containing protein n=1 Tax=Lichtheimia corymbifera JMRC:FSU:9682 TaxID=1263082 RepID=A0A068S6J1_9FUNG|nr:predicted protein [Lichtheimia corymbifera JMRC:FSU:9682]
MRSAWRAIPISQQCVLCRHTSPRLRSQLAGQRTTLTGSFIERRKQTITTAPLIEERSRTRDLSIIDCLERTRENGAMNNRRYPGEQSKAATMSEFYRVLATQDVECIWPIYTFLYQHQYHRHLTVRTYRQLFAYISKGRPTQRNLNRLLALVEDMKERGMKLTINEYNMLINWVGGQTVPVKRSHHLTAALSLFNEMQQHYPPSVVSYNTLIHIASQLSDVRMAQRLYHDMVAHDIQPDVYTYATLLSSMGRMGDLDGIEKMVNDLKDLDHSASRNVVVWNAVLSGYTCNHMNDKAQSLFQQMHSALSSPESQSMPAADSETFRIYMQAMLRENRRDEALDLLKEMELYNMKPTTAIYNALFASFMDEDPEEDMMLRDHHGNNDDTASILESLYTSMQQNDVTPNSETMHALVSALLDAGDIQRALKIFVHLSKQEDQATSTAPLQGIAVAMLTKRRHTLDHSRPRKLQPNQELLDRLTHLMAKANSSSPSSSSNNPT